MQILKVGDVSFVQGWQRPYVGDVEPLTKVKLPKHELFTDEAGRQHPKEAPTSFYDAHMPALDALIETPIAFCILAPDGWSNERSWYPWQRMAAYGWQPVAWRESTHKDKTFVQLYMRQLERPDLKERPIADLSKNPSGSISYSGSGHPVSDMPYLGCSSLLLAFDEPKGEVVIPKINMYRNSPSDQCLTLVRVARPSSLRAIVGLKAQGFRRIISLAWNSYWVRGKAGIGSREACEV